MSDGVCVGVTVGTAVGVVVGIAVGAHCVAVTELPKAKQFIANSICTVAALKYEDGITEREPIVRKLSRRSRVFNALNCDMEDGIVPVNSFEVKYKPMSSDNPPILEGMLPVRPFSGRARLVRDIKLPIEEGIEPMMLVANISSATKFFRSPISVGSVPNRSRLPTEMLRTFA